MEGAPDHGPPRHDHPCPYTLLAHRSAHDHHATHTCHRCPVARSVRCTREGCAVSAVRACRCAAEVHGRWAVAWGWGRRAGPWRTDPHARHYAAPEHIRRSESLSQRTRARVYMWLRLAGAARESAPGRAREHAARAATGMTGGQCNTVSVMMCVAALHTTGFTTAQSLRSNEHIQQAKLPLEIWKQKSRYIIGVHVTVREGDLPLRLNVISYSCVLLLLLVLLLDIVTCRNSEFLSLSTLFFGKLISRRL